MKKILYKIVLSMIVIVAFSMNIAMAVPDPGGAPGVPAPIDGGLSVLLVAGLAYGAKKLYETNTKEKL